MMTSQNDYKILQAIIDKKDKNKGIIPSNGTTKKEIIEKTALSDSKVTLTIYKFLSANYIECGLSKGNSKTYIFTEKGLREYMRFQGVDPDKDEE